jgi:hypothetical protein
MHLLPHLQQDFRYIFDKCLEWLVREKRYGLRSLGAKDSGRGSGSRDIDAHALRVVECWKLRCPLVSCACQSNSFDPIPHPF